MRRLSAIAFLFALALPLVASSREARLVRYPHYHQGKIAFTYLGDIWTAAETGQNIRRITDSPWRDKSPNYSPDGKWIAFISDRTGREELYIIAPMEPASRRRSPIWTP